jgi:hypothetical protein
VFWFTSEVSDLAHGAVVLAERLVQEYPCPISMSELCLADELNSARLDSVHVNTFPDDE